MQGAGGDLARAGLYRLLVEHGSQMLGEMPTNEATDSGDEGAHHCGLAEVLVQVNHAGGAGVPGVERGAFPAPIDECVPFRRIGQHLRQRGGQTRGVAGFDEGGRIAQNVR